MGIQESRIRKPEARRGISGFTLIELLVAMTILVIITLIVARIFQQAGVAWDTGTRKVEQLMNGRAVTDFLAQQLSHAVADTNGTSPFNVTGLPATFYVLEDANASTGAIRQVTYASTDLADGITDVTIAKYGDESAGLPVYGTVTVKISTNVYQTGFYFLNRNRNRL